MNTSNNHVYDIVVVGGGISGAVSAIAAARLGADVLVVEQYGFMGGMLTCAGVGPMMTFHAGDRQIIKGIVSEMVDRLVDKGLSPGHIEDTLGFTYTNTPVSSEGIKRELDIMLSEAGGKVLYHTMLADVTVNNQRIEYITVCNKKGLSDLYAKIFIDATGDGDLFAKAGVPYTKGREVDGKCQPMTLNMKVGNVDREELKKYLWDIRDRVKHKRVIETLDTIPRLFCSLFAKEIKDEKDQGGLPLQQKENVLFFETDVLGEAVLNTSRLLDYDPEDPYSISKAEIEGRAQAEELMKFLKKQRGFENCYLESTGPRIGVRSSRQLKGLYTLEAEDLKESKKFTDTIAHGAYPIDIHSPDGMNTISYILTPGQYYNIPYRTLLNDTVHNLITVGRCISASFEAQASIRVTPIAGSVGQAGGTAAYLCLQQGKLPAEIDIRELQRLLVDNNMFLTVDERQLKTFTLIYPWDTNGYCPDVRYELGVNEKGFTMHITVPESEPRRVETQHFTNVCLDSCVEWFVNFMPDKCDRYFNFEVNANGAMNVSFRKDRYDSQYLTPEDIESLDIRTEIHEEYWEVSYTVPFALIRKYIPDYVFRDGMTIRANFYKCGGLTEHVHHGVWKPLLLEKPDFHRPEFFGEIVVGS